MSQAKARLVADVAALAPRLDSWSRALAAATAVPRAGPDVPAGAAVPTAGSTALTPAPGAPLATALAGAGFELRREIPGLPSAFVADWQGAAGGPRLALLAEYDVASPDEDDLPVTCQHHLAGAAITGAAIAVARQRLPGVLRVIGMPARPGVRRQLCADGLLEGAAGAFLAHPGEGWQTAIATLALLPLSFVFFGRRAHASTEPHQGINALDACIGLFNAVAALRQHLPPWEQVHGIISEGGRAPNLVPERAAAVFYLRAPDTVALTALSDRVQACAQGAATAAGARVEVHPAAPPVAAFAASATLAGAFVRNLQAMGAGPLLPPGPPAGSSDAGDLSAALPCLCAVFPPGEMVAATKALALTLFEALTQPELLARAAAEHAAKSGPAT